VPLIMALKSKVLGLVVSVAALAIVACAEPTGSELFRKLSAKAEQGSAQVQYNLGMLYNNGIGTAKDPHKAFALFEKSAASGDPLASYKVGCYYAGQFPGVVAIDYDKALAAKLVAAKGGYYQAQHDVANMYASKGDFQEAAKWWSAAAEQGDVGSAGNLAEAHRSGDGVSQSDAKALVLLLVASRAGISGDQRSAIQPTIESLKKSVGPEGVAQAERVAAAWVPKSTELSIRADLGIREAQRLVQ
jgi:uncharacterized protein